MFPYSQCPTIVVILERLFCRENFIGSCSRPRKLSTRVRRRVKCATQLLQASLSPERPGPGGTAEAEKFPRPGSRHRPRVRSYRAFSGATTDIWRRFAAPQYRYYLFRMWSQIVVGLARRLHQRSPLRGAPSVVGARVASKTISLRRGQPYHS